FTPSTKAPMGQHDEPIPYEGVVAEIGPALAERGRDLTVEILARGNEIAAERGILLADTKVEFGLRGLELGQDEDVRAAIRERGADCEIVLADEVLTPDSSRFWPVDGWEPGRQQP